MMLNGLLKAEFLFSLLILLFIYLREEEAGRGQAGGRGGELHAAQCRSYMPSDHMN